MSVVTNTYRSFTSQYLEFVNICTTSQKYIDLITLSPVPFTGLLGVFINFHSQDNPLEIKQNHPNEKEFIKAQETEYFGE